MGKFTSGFVAGGVLAAVGLSLLLSDDKTRRRVRREGKRAVRKAGDFFNGVTDMF